MQISLTDQDGRRLLADVNDATWVHAAAEACWAMLGARGAGGSVTARETADDGADRARICTVTYELHDE